MGPMEIGVIAVALACMVGLMVLNHYVSGKVRKFEKENKPANNAPRR